MSDARELCDFEFAFITGEKLKFRGYYLSQLHHANETDVMYGDLDGNNITVTISQTVYRKYRVVGSGT